MADSGSLLEPVPDDALPEIETMSLGSLDRVAHAARGLGPAERADTSAPAQAVPQPREVDMLRPQRFIPALALLVLGGASLGHAVPCPPDTMAPSFVTAAEPRVPWCGTQERWEAKLRSTPALHALAGCPLQGSCDNPGTRDATTITPLTIRVIAHVIRNGDGSGGISQSVVDATMAQLNADFAANGTGLQFTLVATRFHNDAELACIGACTSAGCATAITDIETMKSRYAETPATHCNVYFSCQDAGTSGTLLGVGNFPWDPDARTTQGGLWVNNVATGTGQHITSHEMGHTLGLWHTHHGVTEVTECGNCYEFASGVEGDIRGDFASDTPPTPVNFTCFEPGDCDCNVARWPPTQPQNFMSYAPSTCQSLFTPQQARRLQCWTKQVLGPWYGAPPPPTPALHVQDQAVTRVAQGGGRFVGRDDILIQDGSGLPAAGASVTAAYSGPSSGTLTGTTGSNGRVILTTPVKKNPRGEWCFEVTAVSKAGHTYDRPANVVTRECESGPVFATQPGEPIAGLVPEFRLRLTPNPLSARGVVEFGLEAATEVSLELYDLVGRRVRTLATGWHGAGTHRVGLDRSDSEVLAAGMYFVRLRWAGGLESRVVVIAP